MKDQEDGVVLEILDWVRYRRPGRVERLNAMEKQSSWECEWLSTLGSSVRLQWWMRLLECEFNILLHAYFCSNFGFLVFDRFPPEFLHA